VDKVYPADYIEKGKKHRQGRNNLNIILDWQGEEITTLREEFKRAGTSSFYTTDRL